MLGVPDSQQDNSGHNERDPGELGQRSALIQEDHTQHQGRDSFEPEDNDVGDRHLLSPHRYGLEDRPHGKKPKHENRWTKLGQTGRQLHEITPDAERQCGQARQCGEHRHLSLSHLKRP
jgi:hypothetical protein